MIDIIVPVYNNLSYTKQFIDSLLLQTKVSFQLIIIDNGSNDGTKEYLNSLNCKGLKLIYNEVNLGYVKAINQGLKASFSNIILLANNDIILSKDLLYLMSQSLKNYDIVAPYTNSITSNITNPLLVEYTGKSNLKEINIFANDLFNKYNNNIIEVEYVFGHCMMISRKVIKKVGLLDEIFGLGNYDDIDFCKRAKNNGFKIGLIEGAFVYHFCHTTFKEMGIEINEIITFNKDIFDKKWS